MTGDLALDLALLSLGVNAAVVGRWVYRWTKERARQVRVTRRVIVNRVERGVPVPDDWHRRARWIRV